MVCFATASSAVDLALSFFKSRLLTSSTVQGVARGVLIATKAVIRGVTPDGSFAKVSVMSSISVSTDAQVVGTGTWRLKRLVANLLKSYLSSSMEASLAASMAASAAAIAARAVSASALAWSAASLKLSSD